MVIKKLFSAVLATLVILAIFCGSTVTFAQTQTATATAKPTKTIAQIAANDTNFTTLVRLLKLANITALDGPGNYTFFAPNNAAFSKLNTSTLAELQNNTTELKNLLYYHVISKKYLSSDFTGNGTLQTVSGLTLPFSANGTNLVLGSGSSIATVTKADINATNGEIHVIDGVLIPPAGAATGASTASATASGGFLGLPGFEAVYAVAGLLVVAYLVMRRRK